MKVEINIEGSFKLIELPINHNGYKYVYSVNDAFSTIKPLVNAYLE